MLELIVIGLLMWGSYEHGAADVKVPPCVQAPLVVTECPTIRPPEDDSFGATTRSYTSLVTQYQKCKVACGAK